MNLYLIQLGTVADWVAALGTSGALLLTYYLLRKEIGEIRARDLERKAAQASLVSAWTLGYGKRTEGDGVIVRFQNASQLPIYSCTIVARADAGEYPPSSASDAGGAYFSAMAPGEHGETFVIPAQDPPSDALLPPPAKIMFTDATGAHWRRRADGRLESLAENVGGAC